ncbi:MAG: tRNA 2-thiouridine(34) synthase MnmA [Clostridia bacterium]|nr:tRNA 2-thiouridine(34) synthase MnmA [Clostridia bacterium]
MAEGSKNNKIVVGMSGGVDSAVAAYLLKKQGYETIGVFMRNWEESDDDGVCTADEDYNYVRKVCEQIGISYYTVNFTREYWDRVFEYFLKELRAGRTPNPDVMCNKEIKFKAFLEFAMKLDASFLATGHYARIAEKDGKKLLLRGEDDNKDQTYFLYNLGQKELEKTMFPIGEIKKSEVRRIAKEAGLASAQRKDSTGICFIGERDFNKFIAKYLPSEGGDIINIKTGEKAGSHNGLMFYTLGQRKGLGIGGNSKMSEPWFVAGKDIENNILYAVQGDDDVLYSTGCEVSGLSFVAGSAPSDEFKCTVRLRHRQKDRGCTVKVEGDAAQVIFDDRQRAVTPGQSAVFYDGEVCLGGGIVEKAWSANDTV